VLASNSWKKKSEEIYQGLLESWQDEIANEVHKSQVMHRISNFRKKVTRCKTSETPLGSMHNTVAYDQERAEIR